MNAARAMRGMLAACALACSTIVHAEGSGAPPVFQDTIEQRLQACVVCHGERGGGVADAAFPRLAGQPAAYLVAQMKAFRDRRRLYAPMNFLMSRQTDEYFAEIAAYFAAQDPDRAVIDARRGGAADARTLERGRLLVFDGRADAGLPPCAACHGPHLVGTLPAIPALAGMPRDFLIEQVGTWKTGGYRGPKPGSREPNCMAQVATRMSGDDIVAAASWLSLQHVDGRPTTRPGPLPLDCGSE